MQTDKLISRIKAVLEDNSGHFEAQALAIEYADLMMHVRDRLEQSVTLIRAGNDFAALQVAESSPPLLDLAAQLSFGESLRWLDFCRERGLPYPARLNMAHVDLVGSLYGRKINESHPLYRDYRQAIREHDDLRALGVLTSILRVNPADENAQEEFVRLGEKSRSAQLKKLEALLAEGKEGEACALVERLEKVNIPGLALSPVFQRGCCLREERARLSAEREVERLREAMRPLQETEDWESLVPLLVRYRALEREHRLVLPEEQTELVDAWERQAGEWQREQLASLQHAERLQELSRVLEEAVRTPRALRLRRMPSKRLAALLGEALAEESFFKGELDAALLESAKRLRAALLRRIQRRDTALASAVAVTLALCVAAGVLWYGYRKDEEFRGAALIEARELLARGELLPAEGFLRKVKTRWDNVEEFFASKRELSLWAERARGQVEACKSHLLELQNMDPAKATIADYLAGMLALQEWEAELALLPPDTRGETTILYAGAQNRLEVVRIRLTGEEAPPLLDSVDALGQRLASAVAQPGLPERMAALAALQPDWAALQARGETVQVVMDAEDLEKWVAFSREMEETVRFWQAAERTEGLLSGAVSLDTYFTMLKSEADSANKLVGHVLDHENLLRDPPETLFRPQALQLWRMAMVDVDGKSLFLPGETMPAEAVSAGRLMQNAHLQKLWRYRYQVSQDEVENPLSQNVFTIGEVRAKRYPMGNGYELRQEADILNAEGVEELRQLSWRHFARQTPRGERLLDGVMTPEAGLMTQISSFYETNSGRIVEPVLRTMDRVRRAEGVSPLFKAYLLQELMKVAEDRAEEWGLLFSPSAQRDLAALQQLTQGELTALDWMRPEAWSEVLPQLERLFALSQGTYQGEAEAYWRVMRALREPGFVFIGYVNSDGHFQSVAEHEVTGSLVVLSQEGKLVVLPVERMAAETGRLAGGPFRVAVEAVQPSVYSPVLMLAKTPQEAAQEAELPFWVMPPPGGWDAYVFLSSQRESWYHQVYEQWKSWINPQRK